MPMYNLLEYSYSYTLTLGSLWSYLSDEIDKVDDNALHSKSIEYKTRIVGKTPERSVQPPVPSSNVEVTSPLKYNSFY